MFVANIPFKVALFAALTGHEYQAEGAEGAAGATAPGCRRRLLRAPCDLIMSLLFYGMSVMRWSRCIHSNGAVLSNASRFRGLFVVFFFAICRSRNKCDMCGLLTTLQSQSRRLSDDPVTPGGHESTAKHSATQITQEPESSGSHQTRVSPRGSTRDPLLSCCLLTPLLCRCFCGL